MGHVQADDAVGQRLQLRDAVRSCHRHRHGDARRLQLAHRLHRGAHGGARGQSVIHQDHRTPGDHRPRAVTAISLFAALQLVAFLSDGTVDLGPGGVNVAHDVLVHHPHTTAGNGAHGQLAIAGRAELAYHQNVQLQPQALRHLERHRHTTARQRQHQGIGPVAFLRQPLGQRLACMYSIGERDHQGHGRFLATLPNALESGSRMGGPSAAATNNAEPPPIGA